MNSQAEQWPASPFWDFSLRIYARPEIERCCLMLQDEHGLDVNLVLFAMWAAGNGKRLDNDLAQRLRQFGDGYQLGVMQPLRQTRRALKAATVAPRLLPLLAERRRALLRLELDLERMEQLQLVDLADALSATPRFSAADRALLTSNLAALYPGQDLPDAALDVLASALATVAAATDADSD